MSKALALKNGVKFRRFIHWPWDRGTYRIKIYAVIRMQISRIQIRERKQRQPIVSSLCGFKSRVVLRPPDGTAVHHRSAFRPRPLLPVRPGVLLKPQNRLVRSLLQRINPFHRRNAVSRIGYGFPSGPLPSVVTPSLGARRENPVPHPHLPLRQRLLRQVAFPIAIP